MFERTHNTFLMVNQDSLVVKELNAYSTVTAIPPLPFQNRLQWFGFVYDHVFNFLLVW